MMEKTGEVRVQSTPCDLCSKPAVVIVGKTARCAEHAGIKTASAVSSLRSFTEPLESEASHV